MVVGDLNALLFETISVPNLYGRLYLVAGYRGLIALEFLLDELLIEAVKVFGLGVLVFLERLEDHLGLVVLWIEGLVWVNDLSDAKRLYRYTVLSKPHWKRA